MGVNSSTPVGRGGGGGGSSTEGPANSSSPVRGGGGKPAEGKSSWFERIFGTREQGAALASSRKGPEGLANALTLAQRPLEAVQAGFGASNLTTGAPAGRGQSVRDALLRGDQFGIKGDGIRNTAANLGLDLIDPTIALSGGSKAARFGSRLLTEGGAKDLATKARTTGLTAADRATARAVIAGQIAQGGAGDLAKRSLTDRATGRYAGESGTELAASRALAGLVKEGRGGLRLAGRTVLPGAAIHKAGDIARKVPALGVADQTARALLIPRAGVTKNIGADEADILYNAKSRAAGELERHIGETVRPVQRETKLGKITAEDREGPLLSALERGTPVEPRLQGALDTAKKIRSDASAKIVARNLLPQEFLHAADAYVPRITTDAGFDVIAKATKKGQLPQELAAIFKVSGSLEARKILPDATIPEAEAVIQGMLAKAGVTMPKGKTFYEHDPLKALVTHSAAVERASGQLGVLETLAAVPGLDIVRLVDSSTVKAAAPSAEDIAKARSRIQTARRRVARVEGRLAAEGPARARGTDTGDLQNYTLDPVKRLELEQRRLDHEAGLAAARTTLAGMSAQRKAAGQANAAADAARQAPEGFESIKIGEQTAYVHPELAAEINAVKRLVDRNDDVRRTARHIDEVQNFWRAQVTVMPIGTGFFGRNFQGNLIFNAIDNVGLRDYGQALAIQRGVKKARKDGVPVENVLSPEQARIFRAAEGNNVYNQGAQQADLEHVFPGDQVSAARKHASPLTGKLTARDLPLIGTERGPVQFGRALNATIENNARMANFIANSRRTGSFTEAARRTRLTLFDYSDLTPFEREVGRRVLAFYTFTRKSTGLLLRELAHDPAKVNRITNTVEAFEDTAGVNVDSPLEAGADTLAAPVTTNAVENKLGVGGYLGAAKGQVLGAFVPDKDSGGFYNIAPGVGSENRLEMLGAAILPEYGKYGRLSRAWRQAAPGEKQDLLRMFLGLSPQEQEAYRGGHAAR